MHKSVIKKPLSLLLSLLMTLSVFAGLDVFPNASVPVNAADIIASGDCDYGLTWTLDADGLLTISGSGEMKAYGWGGFPWNAYSDSVKKIVLKNGVRTVADHAFRNLNNLQSFIAEGPLDSVGGVAICQDYSLSYVRFNSVGTLGDWAFSEDSRIPYVVVMGDIERMGGSIFAGYTLPGIYGRNGTNIQTWARNNGINFYVLPETGPEGLTVDYCGQRLSEIRLPGSWAWDDPSATVNGDGGTFTVNYTPAVVPYTVSVMPANAGAHTYGDPVWTWAENYSSATATLVCTGCGKQISGTDNAPQYRTVTPETCFGNRIGCYTASVTLEGTVYTGDSASFTVPNTAIGHHAYNAPVWNWARDLSSATATFVCPVCGDTATETDNESVYNNGSFTAEVAFMGETYSDTVSYGVGNTLQFGSYPQTRVTDPSLISALNEVPKNWASYKYYSGTSTDEYARSFNGQMTPGDWMRFADFTYNGEKYRAVVFDEFRPGRTGHSFARTDSKVKQNGFSKNTVYYFKYEPLTWRVLDPAAGLVICENLIDAQPYQNMIYNYNAANSGSTTGEFYQGIESSTYCSDYVTSHVRAFLNDDFYNTAFSQAQKQNIETTVLNNSATVSTYDSASTADKVFLISYSDALNSAYGFTSNAGRCPDPTEYALSQGYINSCSWWLRTPGSKSFYACSVRDNGAVNDNGTVCDTFYGVCPAMRLSALAADVAVADNCYSAEKHVSQGHSVKADWTWASDHSSATAVVSCAVCGEYVGTATDNEPVLTQISAETCANDRVIKYTATVTVEGETYSTETANISVPNTATGLHVYNGPVWSWSQNKSSATAKFTCAGCGRIETCTDYAPVENDGVFTATIQFLGETYTDSVTYITGETFTYGSYPQTKVTDSSLIASLNAVRKDWASYEYYTGTGSPSGGMSPFNGVLFADFWYEGVKYRALKIDQYRPRYTFYPSETGASEQDDRGYRTGTIYYFVYEPLVWRVLDPGTGFVMCEKSIDAQPLQNVIYQSGSDYYQDANCTVYANNYASSTLRDWLNYEFYETAFTDSQKDNILYHSYGNEWPSSAYNYPAVNDKISLATDLDVRNADYGFSNNNARLAVTTDYAKSQGMHSTDQWRLRSPGAVSGGANWVSKAGALSSSSDVFYVGSGVRPVCYLSSITADPAVEEDLFSDERHMEQGHTFTVEWTWASDCSSATAVADCTVCGRSFGPVTDDAPVSVVVSPEDCIHDRVVKYVATVMFDDEVFTSETAGFTVPDTANGIHVYGEPEWTWEEDHSAATAAFYCVGCDRTETLTDDAPVETDGTYTATVTFMGETYTSVVNYHVGDTFEYGSYPKTRVTSSELLSALNAAPKIWASYGYYAGKGSWDGNMQPGDWMRYADFWYNGEKYRAVDITLYRPTSTQNSNGSNTHQSRSGYYQGKVYYFKYEPLTWRVLDPGNGLAVCVDLIDSQPIQNVGYMAGSNNYRQGKTEPGLSRYANSFATCSMRDWLNYEFYETAFTEAQKANIKTARIVNDAQSATYASATTWDKVSLLSYSQAMNAAYGFSSNADRQAYGTDYAFSQGLDYNTTTSRYWLRTASDTVLTRSTYYVERAGSLSGNTWVTDTYAGVRPIICLKSIKNDAEISEVTFSSPYTVTYAPGEIAGESVILTSGVKCELPNGADLFDVPEGLLFGGWLAADGSVYAAGNHVILSSDTTFTAQWVQGVTVTFNSNGGSAVASQTILPNTKAVKPADPQKAGMSFRGWRLDDAFFSFSTFVTEDITLYAVWEENGGHSLTFTADGNVLTAACANEPCSFEDGRLELILNAPEKTVYGDEGSEQATLTGFGNFNLEFGLSISEDDIRYYSGDTLLLAAPTQAGDYTTAVTITIEGTEYTIIKAYTIAKATPAPELPAGLAATYGDTLESVALPGGWTWNDALTTPVGNAGSNTFTATFTPEDTDNYSTVPAELSIAVGKAAPEYEIPAGLTVLYGKTLADVSLPEGWAWNDPADMPVGCLGDHTFNATFTPEDTDNYNTVTKALTVNVYTDMRFVEASAPTCTLPGNTAYYTDNHRHYYVRTEENELVEIELYTTVIPAAGHVYGTEGDARFTCTVCGYVDQQRKEDAEYEDMLPYYLAEFNACKEEVKRACDSRALPDDSDACRSLIEEAKRKIDALPFERSKMPDGNNAEVYAVLDQLNRDLASQRGFEKTDACPLCGGFHYGSIIGILHAMIYVLKNFFETLFQMN